MDITNNSIDNEKTEEFEKKVKDIEDKHQKLLKNVNLAKETKENQYRVTIEGITEENKILQAIKKNLEKNIKELQEENKKLEVEIKEINKKFNEKIKEKTEKIRRKNQDFNRK